MKYNNVYTLLCERDVDMALITVPMILHFLVEDQRLYIFDDGSIMPESGDRLKKLSEKVILISKQERDEYVTSKLVDFPLCSAYRERTPYAYKMFDIPLFARKLNEKTLIFTDIDILYLNDCSSFFQRNVNTYLRTDNIKMSFRLPKVLFGHKWKIPLRFNSGYFVFELESFRLEYMEKFLANKDVYNIPYVLEQSCWAYVFGLVGESSYPDEDQFLCRERVGTIAKDVKAVHLIGGLKPMYKIWNEYFLKSDDSSEVRFKLSRAINIGDLIVKSSKRLFK